MVQGLAQRATERQVQLLGAIERLGDDDLQARARRSYRENQRTIEEWHRFLDDLASAHRAMGDSRRGDRR